MKKFLSAFLALILFITSLTQAIQIFSPHKAYADTCIYYLEDGQGNLRFVTDYNGAKIRSTEYNPFGNWRAAKGQANIQMLYQGQQQDPESNMYYLRARYYDPATGRFITKDPIKGKLSNPSSQNPYQYAYNNPINLSDPSGEMVGGGCVNANIGLGAFVTCSICLVGSSEKEVGIVTSIGFGGSTGLATGVGGGPLWSPNSNSIMDLEGQDIFSGGSALVGGGVLAGIKIIPTIRPIQVDLHSVLI